MAPGDTDWSFYNRRPDGNRYSELDDINAGNVGSLVEICRVKVASFGAFTAGPLMVSGVIYTTSDLVTIAIDAVTCDVIWKSLYVPSEPEIIRNNRGVAYEHGVLFRGTSDGRLVAYDAASGQERWRVKAGDPTRGEFISSAPLAWHGRLFVGVSGGDWGIQGRMMAFDQRSGRRIWSFNTVPAPGEFGNDTWTGDSWKHGGGGTWTSYTLDIDTGELFVPVANPSPDFNGDIRKGDNLYTNSVLVLDANTGKRLWHYQTLEHDTHDYGVTAPPVLVTLTDGRKAVAVATKGGYLYVVDRQSHTLIYKSPVTTIMNHETVPTEQGVRVCPGGFGGVEWNSPGYDVVGGSLIVGAVDWCSTISIDRSQVYAPAKLYFGGSFKMDAASSGRITSFDVDLGKERWRLQTKAPVVSGITTTAGGVTFVGDMGGTLYALRTDTGDVLAKWETGGTVAGGIITYRLRGRQLLAVSSGNVSRSSWGEATGAPSMVIYALPEHPMVGLLLVGERARGAHLFEDTCNACHGVGAAGGSGPALSGASAKYPGDALAEAIKKPKAPMPALFPSLLSNQDVADLVAYIRSLSKSEAP